MKLNLVADRVVRGKIYPALAKYQAEPYTQAWREFGQHWPYTIPVRFQEYCEAHNAPMCVYSIDDFPDHSFYPIGLAFFDFDIDYFALLPAPVFDAVSKGTLKVLFYYHEGDNPGNIKQRLDTLAVAHKLAPNCYVFVSGNTAARGVPGFVYFCDFELWYYHRNITTAPLDIHNQPRREFTALNRLHKSWRATAMADLHRTNVLSNSYWSYCQSGTIEDNENPIEIDSFKDLRADANKFLEHAPYFSDELDQEDRNNHSILESKYFVDAYCHIVLETHFDADQSGGTFLTEKTFKPLKHGQMLFIAGPAGSLQQLRDMGYKVFDSILDNSYDRIENNTQRWARLRESIRAARHRLDDRYQHVQREIVHNQQLFTASKTDRLNTLIREIYDQSS